MKEMNHLFHQLDRRSFLKLSGLLGLGAAAATLVPSTSEAVRFNKQMMKVSTRRLAMGTFVSMTLLHSSKDQAEEAMERAFQEIDRLSGMLSRYDRSSAVAFLNKEGHARDLPSEVTHVVSKALQYHELTGGAFDITVKPIVDLFQQVPEGEKKARPTERELQDFLKLVDAGKVEIRDRSIHFMESGMGITLDGIAKGFIVDRASELLTSRGIENHLIDAGGDIRTRGSKQGKKPWTVAIQDPLKQGKYPDVVHMKDRAIATSGNYEVYFDQGKDVSPHREPEDRAFSPPCKQCLRHGRNDHGSRRSFHGRLCNGTGERGRNSSTPFNACESLVISRERCAVEVKRVEECDHISLSISSSRPEKVRRFKADRGNTVRTFLLRRPPGEDPGGRFYSAPGAFESLSKSSFLEDGHPRPSSVLPCAGCSRPPRGAGDPHHGAPREWRQRHP
jgi:FAD:protein FMN transferase